MTIINIKDTPIVIRTQKKGSKVIDTAVFDDLENAQLWWDTIFYLHTLYEPILDARPK